MIFNDIKDLPISRKIVLLEIDLPLKTTQQPSALHNYEAGIWFILLTPDPILDITAGVISLIPNPVPDNGLDVGSVTVDDLGYIKVDSLAELRLQEGSFYYVIATTALYFHFPGWEWPTGIYSVDRIIVGQTTGFRTQLDSITGAYINGVEYQPRIKSVLAISKSKDPLFWGINRYQGGTVTLDNADGFFDNYKSMKIYRQPGRILLGFDGLAYADYRVVYSGNVDSYTWDFEKFNIKLQDPRKFLSIQIPRNTLTKSAYPYLDDGNVDAMKPIAYGSVRNAELICLNETEAAANFTFLLMDTEFHAVTSVSEVRVDGVLLASSHWTLNAAAGTLSIPSAYCVDDLTNITADFIGANIINSLAIVKDIIDNYGGIEFISTNYNMLEYNTTQAQARNCGLYLKDPKEISKIIENCCIASDVCFMVQDDGLFSARIYDTDRIPVKTIYTDEWIEPPVLSLDEGQFLSSVIIKYNKDQKEGKFYQYLNDTYESDVVYNYRSYNQKTFETILVNESDAIAKSESIMELSKNITEVITRKTGCQNIELSLMDFIVAAPSTRVGGVEFWGIYEVLGITKNLEQFHVELKLKYVKSYIMPEPVVWFAGRLWNHDLFYHKLYSVSYGE